MTIVGCSEVWLGAAKLYGLSQMHVGSDAVFTILIIAHFFVPGFVLDMYLR